MVSNSKVLLSEIPTLTFFDGEKTNFRRTSPADQLVCQGPGCNIFRPDVIQCYNKGGSGTDVNWKCEADLPAKLKLGRVEVGCKVDNWAGCPTGHPNPAGFGSGAASCCVENLNFGLACLSQQTARVGAGWPTGAHGLQQLHVIRPEAVIILPIYDVLYSNLLGSRDSQ
ncbi:hypothetical protein PGT21_034208 [Puccinia graminis f. sp. tritici]|uniref:Store-operated calcium entry-associated regulatory factor n=1 Tax=Puccinia graminis f. sp. tritici TaxID=56615 RepID=A0A5B0PK00_PUCGR|nr:hypothetical protein PGT21_034208 [Puccinia graminis f. sp. tritici]